MDTTAHKENQRQTPLASVIVLTCNGRAHLQECLESVFDQSYPDFEVILVDNGSRDGSASFARGLFRDRIKIIVNSENRGYAGGNNAGIRSARGQYIALLNDDLRLDRNWLKESVSVLEEREDFAIAAGKILSYYRPAEIDNVGHLFYPDGTFRGRGRLEIDRGQYERVEEVMAASGCAMVLRKKALDQAGLFDEDFFIYGDDSELCLRLRWLGWKAIYAPRAVVFHKYSATTGAYSPFKAFLVERNRIWITIKYFPPLALALSPFYALTRFVLQVVAVLTGKGAAGQYTRQYSPLSLPLVLIKAHLAALAGAGRMWHKRVEINRMKKVAAREFYSWRRRFGLSARELAFKD